MDSGYYFTIPNIEPNAVCGVGWETTKGNNTEKQFRPHMHKMHPSKTGAEYYTTWNGVTNVI